MMQAVSKLADDTKAAAAAQEARMKKLEEMKAQGEVKRFTGTIVDTDGSFSEEDVIRVGPWTAFDRRGNFLGYLPDDERYRFVGDGFGVI